MGEMRDGKGAVTKEEIIDKRNPRLYCGIQGMRGILKSLTPRRQQHTAPAEAAQTTPWSPYLTNPMKPDLHSSSSSSSS